MHLTENKQPKILTAPEVAKLLRISLWSVYDMTRRNIIPHFNVGRNRRYKYDEIMRWARDRGDSGERRPSRR